MNFNYPKEELKRIGIVVAIGLIVVLSLSQWSYNKTEK